MFKINRILVAVGEFGRKPPPQLLNRRATGAGRLARRLRSFHSLRRRIAFLTIATWTTCLESTCWS